MILARPILLVCAFACASLFVPTVLLFAAPASTVLSRQGARIAGRVQNRETGQYLCNARVSFKGTTQFTFTDPTGTYRFANVPQGPVILEVFYTGLETQQAALNVTAGQIVEQDFLLNDSGAPVQLERVTVRGTKVPETESINEQRFAPNLKLVAAPANDEFTHDGNIGELMKSLPGVSAEYWDGEALALSVRGFNSNLVGVTLDGAPVAGASDRDGSTRVFSTPNLSLNNLSRVEVTLVPTPATPADSLGGSINLVSKNAFERTNAQIAYSVFLSANQHALGLGRSPASTDHETYKTLPGFTFDYTLPVTKNFGLVLSANRSEVFDESHAQQKNYVARGRANISNPYVRRARFEASGRTTSRNGASLKADWRVTPNTVLSFGMQGSAYEREFGRLIWEPTADTSSSTTTAALTYGPDFTNGAPGRGDLLMSGGYWKETNSAVGESLRGRFDDGTWRIEAGLTDSNSKNRFGPGDRRFNNESLSARNPVRVNLGGITADGPAVVQVFDNNNQPVDPANVQNYRLSAVSNFPAKIEAAVQGADASVRRQFEGFPFPITLQIGGSEYVHTNDWRFHEDDYTYNATAPGAPSSLAPYLSIIANRPLQGGFPAAANNIPWVSVRKLYAAWQDNPALFTQTPAQLVSSERSRLTNSQWIRETVTAAYLQGEAGLFRNRLGIVTGVRWEETKDVGLGPLNDPGAVFLRDARGAFVRDAQGRQILRPEAGAPGSLDALRLTIRERASRSSHTYDGYYPSLNATWHATDNFQIRLGWAKTYGRPDLQVIIPNATINQANLTDAQFLDPSQLRGTIRVNNPALKPWSADNYDLSFEYYSDQGGFITLGIFQKNIRNFFGDTLKPATAEDLATLGLDSSYLGWNLSTQTNTDRARIGGVTLNFRQSLRAFGSLGRNFSVFGNVTRLQLHGEREADFTSFIKRSANWGFKFSARSFECTARWNYRGQQRDAANSLFGPDAYDYTAATTFLDVNLEYRARKQMVFFVTARNLLNEPRVDLSYGTQTPSYARQWGHREYGAQFTAGIKGAF